MKHIIIYSFCIHCSFLQAGINTSNSNQEILSDLQKQVVSVSNLCADLSEKRDSTAIEACENAIALSKKAGMDSLTVINLSSIASVLYYNKGAEDSYKYLLEAKQIADNSENKALKMPAYYGYSLRRERFIDIEIAVDYLNQALKISNELGDIYYQSKLIAGIGFLFTEAELYEDAKEYFSNGLDMAKEKEDAYSIALMESFLAIAYRELGDFEKSRYLFDNAYQYFASTQASVRRIVYGMAKLESKQGNYESSNAILLGGIDAIQIDLNAGNYAKELVANNYYQLGEYNRSLHFYMQIEPHINKLFYKKFRTKIFKGIADCHNKLGQFEIASTYYQKHATQVDIYIKDKLKESITTASLKYQLHKKDAENKYLTSQRQNLFLLAGILVLLSFLLIYVHRKQKGRNKFLTAVSLEQEKINDDLLTQSQRKDMLNEELTSRNQELSSFAGIVAHDIKSPIRTTNSFVKLIRKHIQQDERLINYLNFIEQSNQRLNVLIDDLLAFTQSGKYINENQLTDLNQVIQIVKNNLAHQITEKSAEIRAAQLPTISANESALVQLFQNIITNSIKFTKSNQQPIIEISIKHNQDVLTIRIKDNGIGMEQAYLNKIFDPLTKFHHNKEFEGSGLGLATCKKIITHLGGIIEVESKLNEGSTFKIHFPTKLLAYHTNQNFAYN